MALLTPLSLDDARELAGRFGLELASVEALELGSVNSNFRFRAEDGAVYFARAYEEQGFEGAWTEARLLSTLHAAGVPVVPPLSTPAQPAVAEYRGKPFAIFPWVPGDWLCLRRVGADHCRSLGQALARVHRASFEVGSLPAGRFRPEDLLARLTRVEGAGAPQLSREIARIRRAYSDYLPRRADLPGGVCHGDLFRDNVLWVDSVTISALLDFESASLGPFTYDLMVTTLAWCFVDSLVSENVRALFEGYASVRVPTEAERRALEVEGALACLRFATTRITDFELRAPQGRPPARDFRRFLQRLDALESGVLDAVRDCLR